MNADKIRVFPRLSASYLFDLLLSKEKLIRLKNQDVLRSSQTNQAASPTNSAVASKNVN